MSIGERNPTRLAEPPPRFTQKESAQFCGVSVRTFRRWAKPIFAPGKGGKRRLIRPALICPVGEKKHPLEFDINTVRKLAGCEPLPWL